MNTLAVFVWTVGDLIGGIIGTVILLCVLIAAGTQWIQSVRQNAQAAKRRSLAPPWRIHPRPLPLTFDALRLANCVRLPLFKNAKGEPAHSKSDGSDWCLGQWSNATLGELGEAANIIKKIERGDLTLDEARERLADELADVQTYLDILAYRAGINLGEATVKKWDEVSERIGVSVRLSAGEQSQP